ncbi:MAG: hypothetical protein KDD82_11220 [Planctomycetes bacterium]|nr:hypothetical protein [Planctomycetota bacterium]
MSFVRIGMVLVALGMGYCAAQAPQPPQQGQGRRPGAGPQGQPGAGAGKRAKQKARKVFARIDTNNDGKIDAAEAQAAGKPDLMQADADGDGFVTPQELAAAARKRMAQQLFDRIDANKDGVLDATELQGPAARLLKADADNDGQVTKDELKAFLQAQRPQGPGGQGPGGQGPGGQGPGGQGPGGQGPGGRLRQAIQAADANQDGKLDATEWPAGASASFADVDANNDGFVDHDEVRAYVRANQASPL